MREPCEYCDAYRDPSKTTGYDPYAWAKGAKYLPCPLHDARMQGPWPLRRDEWLVDKIRSAERFVRVAREHYKDERMAEAHVILARELRAIAAERGIEVPA